MGSTGNAHIAIMAFPFGTHAAPLFSLAAALAAQSPAATFSFLNSARSNASLSRAIAPGNLRLYAVSDGCPDGYTPPPHNPEEEVSLFLGVSPGNFMLPLEAAVEAAGGQRVTCVVSDAFLWFAGKIAGEIGVPWVPVWTGGPCSLAAHIYTDVLRSTVDGREDLQADEHLTFIPYASPLRVRDLPEGVVYGDLNSVFARLLHRMAGELPRAAAVALNTFRGLDPGLDAEFDAKFKKTLPIGPLSLLTPPPPEPDRYGCLSWLDGQAAASVAYVGFGTLMCPPPPELAALAEALEASGAPFLWSLKEEGREHLPAGFLDRTRGRGMVVAWTPQAAVLRHPAAGVFVTHCGWNSVMESVSGGVPMLCRPFLGDQRLNAGVVAEVWGVGVRFEGGVMTRDGVAAALDVVLRREEGKRMREKARGIGEKAAEAVRSGGSSTRNFESLLEMIIC